METIPEWAPAQLRPPTGATITWQGHYSVKIQKNIPEVDTCDFPYKRFFQDKIAFRIIETLSDNEVPRNI